MPIYKFDENNSGGGWWLSREDYDNLLAAGWYINKKTEKAYSASNDLFGTDVPWAWRHSLEVERASIQEAVEEFERITGQDFFDEGCNCCGAPFSISGDGEYLSGDSISRVPQRPF